MNHILGLALFADAAVHLVLWGAPRPRAGGDFDPRRSWVAARAGVADTARRWMAGAGVATAGMSTAAGTAVLAQVRWAAVAPTVAAVASVLLTTACLQRGLRLVLALDALLLAGATTVALC